MSELTDLFGEWAYRADGTPHTAQPAPVTGQGAWGPITAAAEPITCIVLRGHRLIRSATGNEIVSSILLYVEPEQAALFPLNTPVLVDGFDQTTVVRVDNVSHEGLFDYAAVFCE